MKSTISRRSALKRMSLTAAGGALSAGLFQQGRATDKPSELAVSVLLNEPIGTIKPAIYSHFTEHIGGVIYDGVWVGRDSKVPNIDGIRRALVDHVRRLGSVVIRWPGGCFADKYHWRDGIGPTDKRPRRFGRWQEVTESNQFGTHEFMRFCRLCGAEPYFGANVGTGSPEEFQQWVEYCNAPTGKTTLAEERAANGSEKPLGVRYWGVGNESWGCGGKFTPEDYCREYRRFTDWLPGYGVPLYLIAAGPDGNNLDWTRRFFKKWTDFARAPIQGWAPHYYCGTTGHALKFSNDQWYEMLDKANRMERLITNQWAALGEFDREHKVKLVIDEWGCWHPAGTEINKRHLFEQMGCLRDALAAALTLDTFNRHADKVDMANIAQLVNNLHSLFLADGDRFVATPTFHLFEMYKPHQGARAVRIAVQAPEVGFQAGGKERKLFRLAGSASVKGKDLTLTLVHTHTTEPAEVSIQLNDAPVAEASSSEIRQTVLTHEKLNAHNTFESPNEVMPKSKDLKGNGSSLKCTLPPASITRLDWKLA
ncbi:MAG TPA: alpha-L-arabinofuranosidase C-terminal domain-containing protein [Gemmataceae bacterium]|jgi:alpha-N-arabinofuranosidase|nr:alpha-L-arabinofuranosidase C-terminal domain-containing protein [Gemmataceae bacterium]